MIVIPLFADDSTPIITPWSYINWDTAMNANRIM